MLKTYLAVIQEGEEGGYTVYFPDVENAYTEGDTIEETMANAQEVLGVMLAYRIEAKEPFPTQSSMVAIHDSLKPNEFAALIQVDVSQYLRASTVVKKAVTIPDWLIKRAEKEGIDLSGTLVEALKEKLGV
ncbi:type II toxin-antitoxin system HicB family antitoxin [Vagococcus sp. BWB3-3]|uniref:Type II toxin-antitoxin system HicB family antitoxin n=1 Tax=Vagococcus allomyrinae TaxID=2794353 RepID=A0A940P758_9ENTE|nr:type II toxin-antitoxin system HicB family antitoxin [Vagococcus allomyrinae]